MSFGDPAVLPALYDGLAAPSLGAQPPLRPRRFPLGPTSTRIPPIPPPRSIRLPPLNRSPITSIPAQSLDRRRKISIRALNDAHGGYLPPGSLLPNKLPLSPSPKPSRLRPLSPRTYHPGSDTADSLTREKKGKMPALSHLLSVGKGRVLSLAADDKYVYAGCQSAENEIVVFSRSSLQPMYRLLGHQRSVLSLLVVEEKKWLVSSSSAGDIRIWSTVTLQPIYIIHPCDDTAGDIYSLAWDKRAGGTLYLGSQAATIEWVNFSEPSSSPSRPVRTRKPSLPTQSASKTVPVDQSNGGGATNDGDPSDVKRPSLRTGRYKPHSFFDNPPSGNISGSSTPRGSATSPVTSAKRHHFSASDIDKMKEPRESQGAAALSPAPASDSGVVEIEIDVESRLAFAHYGYVYTLEIIHRPDGSCWLVSGSGDCDVKIWLAHEHGGLQLIQNFSGLNGAVHCFAVRDSLLYAGQQDGEIKTWDLETGACIRSIQAHEADVLTMSVLGDDVYTAAADGRVLRLDEHFDCTAAWRAHSGIILSSTIVKAKDRWEFITAGNDSYVKIWTIDIPRLREREEDIDVEGEGDVMLYALSKLVAVPTVSDDVHRENCRQGAHLLKKILQQLGAASEVIPGEEGKNPLVLATFQGRDTGKPRKRLLFYGHYDVQPAQEAYWDTDPWTLSGRNGYLYGRGVSDNKGPILAVACAAAALRQRRELDVDLVMIVEGEEEAGSRGFATTVRKHKESIGHIDAVLLSNSTWIDEADPCVVFGMRGVLYANLTVSSKGDNAHSGVDGGAVEEPMFDMVRVLGAIADRQSVKLPGFYDQVRPKTAAEMDILKDVSQACGRPVEELMKVWREPSFSIANITATGAVNKTVIPKKVSADISIRIVPDQDLKAITDSLVKYCQDEFTSLGSRNKFEINVTHSASWWLTSLDSPYFCALEAAVEDVWGVKPLKIREGGTVPTIFWLEQEFQAPCVHLPLGQASDAGHLANERMRLLNLRNGKRVVESYLSRLSAI